MSLAMRDILARAGGGIGEPTAARDHPSPRMQRYRPMTQGARLPKLPSYARWPCRQDRAVRFAFLAESCRYVLLIELSFVGRQRSRRLRSRRRWLSGRIAA